MTSIEKPGILLVANWQSNVGYAWWLMESYWVAIAEHYSEQYNVFLAYPDITTLPLSIATAPIDCIELDFNSSTPMALREQCQFIRQHKVNTIYFSDKPSWGFRYGFFRTFGAKHIVVHDHTPGVRDAAKGIKKWAKTMLHKLSFVTPTAIFATSPFVRARHIGVNCIPAEKCFIVNNGIPDDAIRKPVNIRGRYMIKRTHLVMVMTGRAHFYKGVDFVLECIHHNLKYDGCKNVHFLFLGDGPHLDNFSQLASTLELTDYVTFAGRVNDIKAILQECDFAIHPSKGEVGYSLSILEYMQSELPVIVPDNVSVCGATINNGTGIIYEEGNVVEASRAIAKLAKDSSLRSQLGTAAKQAQQEKYALHTSHEELINAFEAVLSR